MERKYKAIIIVVGMLIVVWYGVSNQPAPYAEPPEPRFNDIPPAPDPVDGSGNGNDSGGTTPIDIDDGGDEEVDGLLLKFFYSPDCVYCGDQETVIDETLVEHPSVRVIKINIFEEGGDEEMKKYDIGGLPSIAFVYTGGSLVTVGHQAKAELSDIICTFVDDDACRMFKQNSVKLPSGYMEELPESGVVLKYFWSIYCGYCTKEEPALQEFLREHPSVEFVRIDVYNEKNIPELKKYNVLGTPYHVLLSPETIELAPGYMTKGQLIDFVCPALRDEKCMAESYKWQ